MAVELEDGSAWRIWPGDLAIPLLWVPSTRLAVSEIDDECCTWAPEEIEVSLVSCRDYPIRRGALQASVQQDPDRDRRVDQEPQSCVRW